MQILMLNHNVSFKGGGTFYRALNLGRSLVRRGHQVTLLASSAKRFWQFERQMSDGVRLIESPGCLPTRWRYGYDYFETIRRIQWLSHSQFDVIHAFDSRPVVIHPALYMKRRGIPLVIDWCDWFGRGGSVEERSNPILRAILRPLETYYEENFRSQADATTVISSTLEKRALGLGIPPATILRLPNGTDPQKLQPLDKQAARGKLNLLGHTPVIGYLGSLFQADADLMIDAFFQVQEIHHTAQLIVIGNPKAEIAQADGITLTGFVSQTALNDYLAACDILWLPLSDTIANRGRWPSKIVDYFASGRPTVACAVGDVAALLEKNQAGIASAPTSVEFARCTLDLLQNEALMARLSGSARQSAENDFNWTCLAQLAETLYRKLQ